jgi:hypothetical protein
VNLKKVCHICFTVCSSIALTNNSPDSIAGQMSALQGREPSKRRAVREEDSSDDESGTDEEEDEESETDTDTDTDED